MAGITVEIAQAQLNLWVAASAAVAKKQAYSINGRSLTLVDAAEIRKQIDYWSRQVSVLEASISGRGRVRFGVAE